MVEALRNAARESQFARAVELVKDAIPETLRISGHNPITLLYKALSEGIHVYEEERCLQLASAIRVVLTKLAEKISDALSDEKELQNALTQLMGRRTE